MTKKEARQKWCPFVRYQGQFGPGTYPEAKNRDGANSSVPDCSLCVADLCMMWVEDNIVDIDKEGHCGLAR